MLYTFERSAEVRGARGLQSGRTENSCTYANAAANAAITPSGQRNDLSRTSSLAQDVASRIGILATKKKNFHFEAIIGADSVIGSARENPTCPIVHKRRPMAINFHIVLVSL